MFAGEVDAAIGFGQHRIGRRASLVAPHAPIVDRLQDRQRDGAYTPVGGERFRLAVARDVDGDALVALPDAL